MPKVRSLTNFMDLKIFQGDIIDLPENKIAELGEHNFARQDEAAEISIDLTGEKLDVEDNKVMKTEDIKKKKK